MEISPLLKFEYAITGKGFQDNDFFSDMISSKNLQASLTVELVANLSPNVLIAIIPILGLRSRSRINPLGCCFPNELRELDEGS